MSRKSTNNTFKNSQSSPASSRWIAAWPPSQEANPRRTPPAQATGLALGRGPIIVAHISTPSLALLFFRVLPFHRYYCRRARCFLGLLGRPRLARLFSSASITATRPRMDHIPLPTAGSRPLLEVPLVCTWTYDPSQVRFADFPGQFLAAVVPPRSEDASSPPASDSSDDTLLRLVQSWLYFGVIAEFFNIKVDLDLFSKASASSDGKSLCSHALRRLRQGWIANQALATDHMQEETYSKSVELLAQALHACERLEEEELDVQGLDHVLLSVRILLCTLAITTRAIAKQSPDVSYLLERLVLVRPDARRSVLDGFQFLQHMLSNGWW